MQNDHENGSQHLEGDRKPKKPGEAERGLPLNVAAQRGSGGGAASLPAGCGLNGGSGDDDDTLRSSWERIAIRLRRRLGDDVYTSWFARVEPVSLLDGLATLSVPTLFLKNWI